MRSQLLRPSLVVPSRLLPLVTVTACAHARRLAVRLRARGLDLRAGVGSRSVTPCEALPVVALPTAARRSTPRERNRCTTY